MTLLLTALRWVQIYNPVTVTARGIRRFRRRPRTVQIRTVVIALASIVGLLVYLVDAPSSASGSGSSGLGSLAAMPPAPPSTRPARARGG